MIYACVTDKAVISNGKPLRIKTVKEVDGMEHDEWYNVHEDRNGVWYIKVDDSVYEVIRTHPN